MDRDDVTLRETGKFPGRHRGRLATEILRPVLDANEFWSLLVKHHGQLLQPRTRARLRLARLKAVTSTLNTTTSQLLFLVACVSFLCFCFPFFDSVLVRLRCNFQNKQAMALTLCH